MTACCVVIVALLYLFLLPTTSAWRHDLSPWKATGVRRRRHTKHMTVMLDKPITRPSSPNFSSGEYGQHAK